MNAYRIILTHFSQRYPKIPFFDSTYEDRMGIASDFLSIKLKDLHMLPMMLPALRSIYKELEELEKAREEAKEEFQEKKREQKEKKKAEYVNI